MVTTGYMLGTVAKVGHLGWVVVVELGRIDHA